MPVDFEFIGNIVLIKTMGRPSLAFTRSQFDEARKRGEKYAQETSLDARKTPTPYAQINELIPEDRQASLPSGGRETLAEPKAQTSEEEHAMAVFLTIELPGDCSARRRVGGQPQHHPQGHQSH
jgi:hypothetical protein